jgi:hypothetical protein
MTRSATVRRSCYGLAALPLALAGCDYDVPIYGVYVPPWLLCSLLGSACAAGVLSLVGHTSAAPYLGNRSVLFVALTVIFAVLLWAIFFKE